MKKLITSLLFFILAVPVWGGPLNKSPNFINSGRLFLDFGVSTKVILDVDRMERQRSLYKWDLRDIELSLITGNEDKVLQKVSYDRGYYKEELGVFFLIGAKSSSLKSCLKFPNILYISKPDGILKSPSGFYLPIKNTIQCN